MLSHLKNLGIGKRILDQKIQEEAEGLINDICKYYKSDKHCGDCLSLKQITTKFTNNVICHMVFGHSLSSDSKFQSIAKEISVLIGTLTKISNIFIMVFFS